MNARRLAGIGWAALILLFYYRRAWSLAAAGPGAWDVGSFLDGGWRWPWPWAAEAAWRAAIGAGGALAVLAAAWGLGWCVLWLLRCRLEQAIDGALFRLAAGLAALSCLSLGLTSLGWYRPRVVLPLVVALAVAGAIPSIRRDNLHGLRMARVSRPGPVAIVALLAIGFALLGALAPEKEYDALWYHLWLPRLWLEHGRPVDVLTEYVALYPLGWELLYGDAMTLGGVVAAKLLHFACLPLLAAVTWRLAGQIVPRVPRLLAATILLTTPTVLWEATTAYDELGLALYVTLGVYALLARERESDPCKAASWFRLAVLCLAFATTIKHLGLVVVALVGLALVVRALAARFITRNRAASRRLFLDAVVLALGWLVLASPWYWRAWSASGNPFFPELFALFGARPPQRWDAVTEAGVAAFKAHFGFGRSPGALLRLPWTLTQHAASFGGCLGPIFLLAAPGALAALYTELKLRATTRGRSDTEVKLRAPTRGALPWLVYLVVGYVAVWASPMSSFQLRFLVAIVPAMCVLAALGLSYMTAEFGSRRTALVWLTAALLALNLPLFTPLDEGDRHGWQGMLTHVARAVPLGVIVGGETEDAYLRRDVPTYAAWQHLASSAPTPPVLVLEVGGGDNLYATARKIPADAALARGAWVGGPKGPAVVRETLDRLHITHVLFDRIELERMVGEGAALASPEVRKRDLVLEYEDQQALLYRVAPTRSIATERNFRLN